TGSDTESGTGETDILPTPKPEPTPEPLNPLKIEIPSSAYTIQAIGRESGSYFKALNAAMNGGSNVAVSGTFNPSNSANFTKSFTPSLPIDYTISSETKTINGQEFQKAYLTYTKENFQIQDGWYINKDSGIIIGTDKTTKLVITNEANAAKYAGDSSVSVVVLDDVQAAKMNIFGGDGKDSIVIDGIKVANIFTGTGADEISLINKAGANNIYTGDGNDDVKILDGSRVTGENSDIVNATRADLTETDLLDLSTRSALGADASYTGNADLTDTEIRSITEDWSGIMTGNGTDTVNIEGRGSRSNNVITGDGDDFVSLKDGGGVFTTSIKDSKTVVSGGWILTDTMSHDVSWKDTQGGNDTVEISGKGSRAYAIGTGKGDDKVTLSNEAIATIVQADEGNDTITVKEKAKVNLINGREGDDEFYVESGANVIDIRGLWGDDTIKVSGKETVVGRIEGREGSDKIYVDDATINQYISGGKGATSAMHSGQISKNDNDTIVINNATVKGDVEGGSLGGLESKDTIVINNSTILGKVDGQDHDDTITIEKSTIKGNVVGGSGADNIVISGSNVEGWVSGQSGDNDVVIVKDGSVLNTMSIDNGNNDKIIITGKNTSVGNIAHGNGNNSSIQILDGATARGTVHLGDGKDNLIEVKDATAHQIAGGIGSTEIKVINSTLTDGVIEWGSYADSVRNITISNSTVQNNVIAGNGNDTININDSTVKNAVNASNGNDTINIVNSTVGNYIASGSGADNITLTGSNVGNSLYGGQVGQKTDGDNKIVVNNSIIGSNIIQKSGIASQDLTAENFDEAAKKITSESIKLGNGDLGLIYTLSGNDEVVVAGSDSRFTRINTEGGDDTIVLKDGAKSVYQSDLGSGDNTNNHLFVNGGSGSDTIIISGKDTIAPDVYGGNDKDTIILEDGAKAHKILIKDSFDDTIIYKDTDKATHTTSEEADPGDHKIQISVSDDKTLIINSISNSNSIDLSSISSISAEFNKIDLKNNSAKLNITAKDVFDANSDGILKIDGENSSHISLNGFNKGIDKNGYTQYESDYNGNTVMLEIKNDIFID
ncbi:hypothetical protein U5B43_08205, partial [Campylobacter sp. 9BO]|uniref:beta strand repeat-containing protein n=1 Tax=Campylobacter sp. 9BO TaxID=3424759 RepID=UPI003D32F2B1